MSAIHILVMTSLVLAAGPSLLFCWNLLLVRRTPRLLSDSTHPRVSVLIPARDEENSIEAAVRSALANTGVKLEVLVLDDHSTDRTAEIVRAIAAEDPRLRLETPPPLPDGWNGKQHACWQLSQRASSDLLVFMDADLRLSSDALVRMVAFLKQSKAELVSGAPRQVVKSFMERLVIPLIHFVLLGYLPVFFMRLSRSPAFSAGVGQLFLARREAYESVDGHRSIKASRHDGIGLPRSFRRGGFKTDLFDATDLAHVRMYTKADEVFFGFAKNADEGLGSNALIVPFTILLLFGQVLPVILLPLLLFGAFAYKASLLLAVPPVVLALLFMYIPPIASVLRFKRPIDSALLHPLGVLILVIIQWYALFARIAGQNISWKGRD